MEKEIIKQIDLFYEINREDLTAQIVKSPNAKGDIYIPLFIKYESKDYKIIGIKEDSFKNNRKITSISMPNDSHLQSIGKNAFSFSSITELFLPKEVNNLEDGWCRNVSDLTNVTISPSNKNFKYLDEEHQIIVGKSDTKQEIFDTIIFANRDILYATIPKYIKYIKQGAFEDCKYLFTIEFEKDSELIFIGDYSFSNSFINRITIPKNVCKICEAAFNCCHNLQNVTFEEGSKLVSFESKLFMHNEKLDTVKIPENSALRSIHCDVFNGTKINQLFIPASVEKIEDGWCENNSKLEKVTLSPSNKNFRYLDNTHQIIVGKSDPNQCNFDTIIFVNRNIIHAKIPDTIKHIYSYSFENY